ncbi:MAG: hypothetical protein RIS79_1839 [Verrucomicrobiota bacterium]
MKRMSAMRTVERAVHDAFGWLRSAPQILRDPDETGWRKTKLLDAGEAVVVLDDENEFHGIELKPSVTRWTDVFRHVLPGAHVVGDQGHIFSHPQDSFVSLCPSLLRLDVRKIRRPIPLLARKVSLAAFHLTGRDHENHGHFLMQHLPRFMAAMRTLNEEGARPIFLLACGHERWQGNYLKALLGTAQNIVSCYGGTLDVKELHYVPMMWDNGPLGPPFLYQQMQACFRRFAGVDDAAQPSGRPIFVTREDAPTRRLSNEPEILDICRRHLGEVDLISLRNVPFEEQIRRFAAAPIVIGAQGQGLTNIIFSRQARLLILEAGDDPRSTGWAAAYRDFACMTGNSALRLFSGGPWPDDGDWTFPADAFNAQLQRVISLGLHRHRPVVLK